MSEPIPVNVVRYRCPHCSRSRAKKKTAQQHIARCWYNPAARGCKTCALYDHFPGGEPCFPGRHCDCNDGHERCGAGLDLEAGLKTGCPRWAPACTCFSVCQDVDPDCPEHGRFRTTGLDTP